MSVAKKLVEEIRSDKGLRDELISELLLGIVESPEVRKALITAVVAEVATKEDVRGLEATFKDDIKRLEAAFRDEVRGLRERMGSLGDRVGSLEGRVGSLEGRVGSLEGRIVSLEARVGILESRLGSLEARVARIEGQLSLLIKLFVAFNLPILVGVVGLLLGMALGLL